MNVVITGASTGIGRATALHLAQAGHRVFAGIRRPADGEALLARAPDNVIPVVLDVTSAADIERTATIVSEAVGDEGLHGLVNNAGIGLGGPVEHLPLDDWRQQFEVNLFGAIAMIQALLPTLRHAPGRIVNVSSIGGRVSTPFMAPYCASKFALEATTDALRIELAPWRIAVVLIEPGAIRTPIWDKARSLVDAVHDHLGEEATNQYGPQIAATSARIARQAEVAIPAEVVAGTIARSLTARRPRIRYLVGTDARAAAALRWLLPDRWMDAALVRLG